MARHQVASSLLKSLTLLSPSSSSSSASASASLLPSFYSLICCRAMSRLFVGGLSFTTEEEGLRTAFSKFGEVIDAKVVKDRETGRSRGFGFVTFMEEKEAEEAMNKMSGQFLDGRVVRVDKAAARPPPPPRAPLNLSLDNSSSSSSSSSMNSEPPVAEDWGTIPSTMAAVPQNLGLYASSSSSSPSGLPGHDAASGLPDLSTLASSSSFPSNGLGSANSNCGTSPTDSSSPLPNSPGFSSNDTNRGNLPFSSTNVNSGGSSPSTFSFDPSPPTKASTKDTGPSFGFIDLDLSNLPPPDPNHVPRRRPPRIRPSSMGDYEFGYYMSETSKFPFNTNFETGIPRSSGPMFDFEFADIKEANAIKKAEWLAIKQAREAEEAAKKAEEDAIKKAKEDEEAAIKKAKEDEEAAIKIANEEAIKQSKEETDDLVVKDPVSVVEQQTVSDAGIGMKEKSEEEDDKKLQESSLPSQNATTIGLAQDSPQTKVSEEAKPEAQQCAC